MADGKQTYRAAAPAGGEFPLFVVAFEGCRFARVYAQGRDAALEWARQEGLPVVVVREVQDGGDRTHMDAVPESEMPTFVAHPDDAAYEESLKGRYYYVSAPHYDHRVFICRGMVHRSRISRRFYTAYFARTGGEYRRDAADGPDMDSVVLMLPYMGNRVVETEPDVYAPYTGH